MPAAEYTVEDQLVSDLVAVFSEDLPAGVPAATPVVHFRATGVLPIPAIIIGHEGFEREMAKGMLGTGRVSLRVALRTDADELNDAGHRAIAAALDREMLALADGPAPAPLPLTLVHAVLRESPDMETTPDRRQITVLRYQVIATRMEPEPDPPEEDEEDEE
jgi:hypothetical protein